MAMLFQGGSYETSYRSLIFHHQNSFHPRGYFLADFRRRLDLAFLCLGKKDREGRTRAHCTLHLDPAAALPDDAVDYVDNPSPVPLPTGFVVKKGSKTCSRVVSSMPKPVSLTIIDT